MLLLAYPLLLCMKIKLAWVLRIRWLLVTELIRILSFGGKLSSGRHGDRSRYRPLGAKRQVNFLNRPVDCRVSDSGMTRQSLFSGKARHRFV